MTSLARLVALAVVCMLAVAGTADAQISNPGAEPAPETGPVLEGPSARMSWSVPSRYARSWDAWRASLARYDTAYVRPARWSVTLDACSSTGNGSLIVTYHFTIGTTSATTSRCRRTFSNLPRLGRFDARVTVTTKAGHSATTQQTIEPKDYVVVSLGDSMASGEGVPDDPGVYTWPSTPAATVRALDRIFHGELKPQTVVPAEWQDRRCHRSARAGHALAAKALEARDPHSSVTFLSLACSGAEIKHLIDTTYRGIQPPADDSTLDPQLDVLREQIGTRHVDALLLSIGINDLGFSDIVKSCAMNWNRETNIGNPDCVYDAGLNPYLDFGGKLEQRYAQLDDAIHTGLDVGEVLITDYPAAPFGQSRGGCGLLGIPMFGIASMEADAMNTAGNRLWWAIGRASADLGWNYVPDMTNTFDGHDYCASDPYLMRLEQSLAGQGTIDGAVHPNRTGHAALANMLQQAMVFRPALPHWRARVVVEQVRVEDWFKPLRLRAAAQPPIGDPDQPPPPPPPSTKYGFDFGVLDKGNWPGRTTHRFTIPKTDTSRWIPVPADLGTFEFDVYDAPRPPRYTTAVDLLVYGPGGTLGGGGTYADGFGAGCHTRVHPRGWSIRYRVDITPVTGGPSLPGEPIPCQGPKVREGV